jgi:hypothetical protein
MQSLRMDLPRELELRLKTGRTELAAFASEVAAAAAAVAVAVAAAVAAAVAEL